MPMSKHALEHQQHQRDAEHRSRQHLDDRRWSKCPSTNSGISNQPMPGARSLCTVAMKLMPVKIDEKPSTNTAMVIMRDAAVRWWCEYGV